MVKNFGVTMEIKMKNKEKYFTEVQLNEILKIGNALEIYAHEHGHGEQGYSPINRLYTAYLHLSADYDQLEDQYNWLKQNFQNEVENSAKHVHCDSIINEGCIKCPKCNSTEVMQTLVGILEGPDTNAANCMDCGWSGMVEDLKENK